jgi:hypothetical protein
MPSSAEAAADPRAVCLPACGYMLVLRLLLLLLLLCLLLTLRPESSTLKISHLYCK